MNLYRRRAGSKVNREEEFLEESITEEEENLIGSSLEGGKIGDIGSTRKQNRNLVPVTHHSPSIPGIPFSKYL